MNRSSPESSDKPNDGSAVFSAVVSAGKLEHATRLSAIIDELRGNTSSGFSTSWTRSQIAEELSVGCGLVLSVTIPGQESTVKQNDEDHSIVAFLLYRDAFEADEILLLATAREVQRHGYMRILLREFLRSRTGVKAVWLEVDERNLAARQLYADLGFIETGRRKNYYPDGGSAILYKHL